MPGGFDASFQVDTLRGKANIDRSSSSMESHELAPPPSTWGSWDEFFFRTGVWGGWDVAEDESSGEIPYQASDIGGAHVHRRVRKYVADSKSGGSSRAAHTCTKHKPPASQLIPGFVFFW